MRRYRHHPELLAEAALWRNRISRALDLITFGIVRVSAISTALIAPFLVVGYFQKKSYLQRQLDEKKRQQQPLPGQN